MLRAGRGQPVHQVHIGGVVWRQHRSQNRSQDKQKNHDSRKNGKLILPDQAPHQSENCLLLPDLAFLPVFVPLSMPGRTGSFVRRILAADGIQFLLIFFRDLP